MRACMTLCVYVCMCNAPTCITLPCSSMVITKHHDTHPQQRALHMDVTFVSVSCDACSIRAPLGPLALGARRLSDLEISARFAVAC
jgi:hypothetical protein